MHPDVQKLLAVQKVDKEISSVRRRLESIPKERLERESALGRVRTEHEQRHAAMQKAEVEQRLNETSIRAADDEIKKLQIRLNTVRNNAEYQATLMQIESVKRERAKVEEEGIELIDRIDVARAEAEAARARLAEEDQTFRAFVAESETYVAEKQGEYDQAQERKIAMMAEVRPELRDLYTRMFQARGGLALCAVEGETCMGCYTSIPPNLMVKVQGGNSVVQCNSCQRIIYTA